ncbi:putative methyltransferase NSUN7, partial [Astyanax mexicanus]
MTSLSVQEVTSLGEERAPEEAPVKVSLAGGGAYAQRGRLGYPDFVYSHAAQIFHTYHVEKPLSNRVIHYTSIPHTSTPHSSIPHTSTPHPSIPDSSTPHTEDPPPENFSSESTTLWAFQMAFSTLTFQELLEDVLMNSCFYSSQQTPDDLMPLAIVMLYDLQDRKFQPREPMTVEGEEPVEEVRRVESSLFSFRRKLEAELARFRIKHNLLSIHHFLPHNLRLKHLRTHTLPLYTWINTLQISKICVFICVCVCFIYICLFLKGRSRGLVASVVRPLVVEGSDVLMVGCFSAETVAHVAVHANANNARVHVCGRIAKPDHREALQSVLTAVGCNNVQVLSERFCDVTEWDSRVQKVRVVLLVPRCSVSGLCRPVQHILSEGGDLELIRDLSQGSVSLSRLNSLITEQIQDLRHALAFPKVNAVVYCTCSVYEEENELLVKRALESAPVRPKQRPFRIVSTGLGGGGEEKFFRMEESESDDGCFICLLKRDEEAAEAETVQDILARAAAKGLLGGLMELEPPDQIKLKKKRKEKRKAADPPPPLSLHQP